MKVSIIVDNPVGLDAFGLTLSYSVDKLDFVGVERTTSTAGWLQLDGQENAPGSITLGGFNDKPLNKAASCELLKLLFATGNQPVSLSDFGITNLVDDFTTAMATIANSGTPIIASVPEAFKLHQNFPNPLQIRTGANETIIRFDLPGTEMVLVELSIYNLAGQLVRRLLSDIRSPGAYELAWHGKDEQGRSVLSGTYWYRLKVGKQTASKQLTVLR